MTEALIKKLESYKLKHDLTYSQLAKRLDVPDVYIHRWRKKNEIKGIYAKVVEEFLRNDRL